MNIGELVSRENETRVALSETLISKVSPQDLEVIRLKVIGYIRALEERAYTQGAMEMLNTLKELGKSRKPGTEPIPDWLRKQDPDNE